MKKEKQKFGSKIFSGMTDGSLSYLNCHPLILQLNY